MIRKELVFLAVLAGSIGAMLPLPSRALDCFDYASTNALLSVLVLDDEVLEFVLVGDIIYAYQDYPATVVAIDISDLSSPQVLGSVEIGQSATYLRRDGDRLFAATRDDGLTIIDISQPGQPEAQGTLPLEDVYDLAPAGDVVYVANGWQWFRVLDVSDPWHPAILAELQFPYRYVENVAVNGSFVHVNLRDEGLRTINVSNPASPQLLATPGFADPISQLEVSDGLVWVGRGSQGLSVFNLANPHAPIWLSTWNPGAYNFYFSVTNERALVCDNEFGLYVLDVTDPTHLTQINALPDLYRPLRVADRGDLAIVNQHAVSLAAVDPTVLQVSPPESYSLDTGDAHFFLDAANGYLYDRYRHETSGETGMQIIDVHSGVAPQLLGRLTLEGSTVGDLAVSGSLAYLALTYQGVGIVDVSDPWSPQIIGEIDLPYSCYDLALRGTWIYAATEGSGVSEGAVVLLNALQPTAPTITESLALPSRVERIDAKGQLVVAGTNDGRVFTLSSMLPTAPRAKSILGAIDAFGAPVSDVVIGGTVTFAASREGVVSIDCADPTALQELDRWSTGDRVNRLALDGTCLYVGSMYSGIFVLDVSDPTDLSLIGIAPADDYVEGLAFDDNALYSGKYHGVIDVLPRQCSLTSEPDRQLQASPETARLVGTRNGAGVMFHFDVPAGAGAALTIFDVRGRRITEIAVDASASSKRTVAWNGRAADGRACPAGIYLARVTTDRGRNLTGKVLLLE